MKTGRLQIAVLSTLGLTYWGVTSVREVARIKLEGLCVVGVPTRATPGFDANAAMNQARDEAYARAARGTNGTFGAAYE